MITEQTVYLIIPCKPSAQLESMINAAFEQIHPELLYLSDSANLSKLPELKNRKLIFAIELNNAGYCIGMSELVSKLYEAGSEALSGSSAVLLLRSPNELNTKSAASDFIFHLNSLGCRFPGHPVVEATGSLGNFLTWQKTIQSSLEDICAEICGKIAKRLIEHNPIRVEKPRILALHSSSHETSNTLSLWRMAKQKLEGCEIEELHVENGTVQDCKGCSFKTCIHFSTQSSCFYGGVMVKEIFPAIEKADVVLWICPNYNDAVSANLTAVINRLTALYRKTSFNGKNLFSVIVSGNSGSDSVAKQLIDALCINKGFSLPPYFSLMATANDPGAIWQVADIEELADTFALNMLSEIKV